MCPICSRDPVANSSRSAADDPALRRERSSAEPPPPRHRIRLRYRKDDARFIGHLDLIRAMERTFRRAELPLRMSAGFHPKPRMTFISPLPVGCRGAGEVMEVELHRPCQAALVLAALARHAPPGLVFLAAESIPAGAAKPRFSRAQYQIDVPPPLRHGLHERIDSFLKRTEHLIERPGRNMPFDIRPHVMALQLNQNLLTITLTAGDHGGAKAREVLAAIGLAGLEELGGILTRAAVELDSAPHSAVPTKTDSNPKKETS